MNARRTTAAKTPDRFSNTVAGPIGRIVATVEIYDEKVKRGAGAEDLRAQLDRVLDACRSLQRVVYTRCGVDSPEELPQ